MSGTLAEFPSWEGPGVGRLMESEHLQNLDVSWGHEPVGIPLNRPPGTFSPIGGEGRDEGVRFMESLGPPYETSSIVHVGILTRFDG